MEPADKNVTLFMSLINSATHLRGRPAISSFGGELYSVYLIFEIYPNKMNVSRAVCCFGDFEMGRRISKCKGLCGSCCVTL